MSDSQVDARQCRLAAIAILSECTGPSFNESAVVKAAEILSKRGAFAQSAVATLSDPSPMDRAWWKSQGIDACLDRMVLINARREEIEAKLSALQSATARITPERISELWKQAMSEGAQHFVGFINRGLVPNFEHPENLTLPQRFAILLLAEMNA